MFGHQQYGLIQCKLCNKIYDEPRVLPCLHSFCGICIARYMDDTTSPNDEFMKCPLCAEEVRRPHNFRELKQNAFLERFIAQAHKDTASVVAGREVTRMTRDALTEAQLKRPEVVANIEHVANTASHLLADRLKEEQQEDDSRTIKQKNGLKLKTSQLQVRAMDIVQSIDTVNYTLQEWADKKDQMRKHIRQRSQLIQDSVKAIERKMLAKLDDRELEHSMKDEAFTVKTNLHKLLRSSLSIVDFLRLLTDYGSREDVDVYSDLIRKRERKLYSGPVNITQHSCSFEHPSVPIDDGLEMMFGNLTELSEETPVWDPNQPSTQHQVSSPSDLIRPEDYDVDLHLQNNSNITDVNVEDVHYDASEHEGISATQDGVGDRLGSRQFSTTAHTRRYKKPPTKSISFDSSMLSGPYDYVTSDNQRLYRTLLHGNTTNAARDNISEHDMVNDKENLKTSSTTSETNNNNTNKTSTKINNVIDSLMSDTMAKQPLGQVTSRRVSAPSSMAIDTLNRRRLNALSILERANISTAGLAMTTDIESGMNDARQEWLRETVKRKVERGDSFQ